MTSRIFIVGGGFEDDNNIDNMLSEILSESDNESEDDGNDIFVSDSESESESIKDNIFVSDSESESESIKDNIFVEGGGDNDNPKVKLVSNNIFDDTPSNEEYISMSELLSKC
jgi:hypothetical protein